MDSSSQAASGARSDTLLSNLLAYARFWFTMGVSVFASILGCSGAMLGLLMPRAAGRRWMLQMPILWARVILWAARCPLEVTRTDALPTGGFLYFSNHQSTLDILALFLALKETPVAFAAKRELFNVPVIGWYLRVAGFIEVDRTNPQRAFQRYAKAGAQIREGAIIAIYPEGTRSIDGSVLPFKKGPFMLAIETQRPIVPVAVDGAQHAARKGTWRLYGHPIRVRIGAPIATQGLTMAERDALLVRTRRAILQLHREIGAEPSPEEPMIAPRGKRSGERDE